MSYLDVSPMIVALRTAPEEFEAPRGLLHHLPSRHSYAFDPEGRVQIHAQCNCAMLSVKPEQEQELFAAYRDWQTQYWRPLTINRDFASHFKPRSFVRKALIDLTGWMHRRLSQRAGSSHHDHAPAAAMMPAE